MSLLYDTTAKRGRHRSVAASQVSPQPLILQVESEPPGRHPPAPGSHVRRAQSVTGRAFRLLGLGSAFRGQKAVSPRYLFHPHGTPNIEVSLVVVL